MNLSLSQICQSQNAWPKLFIPMLFCYQYHIHEKACTFLLKLYMSFCVFLIASFLEFSYSCLSFKFNFSIFVSLALIHTRTDLKFVRMQHWNFNKLYFTSVKK